MNKQSAPGDIQALKGMFADPFVQKVVAFFTILIVIGAFTGLLSLMAERSQTAAEKTPPPATNVASPKTRVAKPKSSP